MTIDRPLPLLAHLLCEAAQFHRAVADSATARRIAQKRAKTPSQIGVVSGAKCQVNTQWLGSGP